MACACAVVFFLLGAGDASTQPTAKVQRDLGGIVRGDVSQKRLTLIFAGGEFAEGVPTILETCAARGVKASFFVTGDFLRLHPDAARSIIRAGHVLGPHGDRHLLYCDWQDRSRSLVTRDVFERDLRQNLSDLKALGAPPTRFFLPPYEWYNAEQVAWAGDLGLTLINFTPGSGSNRDYIPEGEPRFASSRELVDSILRFEAESPDGLRGFLLLLHTGSKREDKMHDHLETLLESIQRRGYKFVALDELLR